MTSGKNVHYAMVMRYMAPIILFAIILQYSSCSDNYVPPKQDPNDPSKLDWLIPRSSIINRGIATDSLPPVSSPAFVSGGQVTLNDNDRILAVNILGEFRVYPEKILNYHEVVNDVIKNKNIAITYCPLTGTSMAWDVTNLQGITTKFAATTYIYNCNDILFDNTAKSYWQQLYSKCVAGSYSGFQVSNLGVLETTWSNWKSMFPAAKVLSTATGYKYNYNIDPYAGYAKVDTLPFFASPVDKRLPLKERVLGLIVGDHAKVYQFSSFADSLSLVEDNFQGLSVVVAGSRNRNFIVCFERRVTGGPELEFSIDTEASNIIMIDNEGTKWDIFGNGVDGPGRGQRLNITNATMGYWFAFGAMYPDALIYTP
jgi:hypothetical protein